MPLCMKAEEKKTRAGRVAALIVAAGRGERAGQSAEGPKQYRPIGGRAVLAHAVAAFLEQPLVDQVAVVIHADDIGHFETAIGPRQRQRILMVHGGPTRQESTRLGLLALRAANPDCVLIHDGVRPFLGADLIERVVGALTGEAGVLPALPVSETLKRIAADGLVAGTVDRNGLFSAQTPQGFPFQAILDAHERAFHAGKSDFTDDAAIAEWAGLPVRIVEGSADNVKLTWARDIALADERLSRANVTFPDIRVGNGYDVHAFETGDHVTLCGVDIPHGRRLSGHSDADVGLHALTDALLATCGAGDIGTHFPPSDPQWKGAASRLFVEHAAAIVRGKGGRIANADVTLICEAPKIGPHRQEMVAAMADMLKIAPGRISVKATTNEKLGFVGRGEGIAAIATVSVAYPGELPG
jgi:2-C-methyl-D-erythritol 4-phosphate cytidylyltransferase/2-C-methyl-D-erythritol 2,4-cyclodiphosphate synthase